nr:glutamate-rich protein 6B [Microcebus murinus]
MSAKNSLSSEDGADPSSPTNSQHSTQILSSEEEESKVELDEERLQEEPLGKEEQPDEEEYLEEVEYLQEEKYLQEKLYPYEENLYEDYLKDTCRVASKTKFHLNARSPTASSSTVTTYSAVPLINEAAYEPPDSSSLFATSRTREEGCQTEWIYEEPSPRWTLQTVQEATMEQEVPVVPKVESEEDYDLELLSEVNFWNNVTEEHMEKLEVEDLEETFLSSSYQSVFKTIVKEMAARNEIEADIDIPLSRLLESGNRRKLGILLKKNYEKYKETILWLMKKREAQVKSDDIFTFNLLMQPPPPSKESVIEEEESKKPQRVVKPKKKVELDTEWIKASTKMHQGDGNLVLYPNETVFQILFPDGTGQIHYPSGNLAMIIFCTKAGKFTYLIMEDCEIGWVRGLINNSGHATFYDENGDIWLSLSRNLGYYFCKDKHLTAWNWWNLSIHVHAPPIKPISLSINQYIWVQIQSQDKIFCHFTHERKRICFNLGTRYKFILPDVLKEMKNTAILELEPRPMARKIQVLLGKISRILQFLSISDLETFTEACYRPNCNSKKRRLSPLWI